MRAVVAQLPASEDSDDKVFVTPNAVVLLDGASAFRPVPIPPATYASQLGANLRDQLLAEPSGDLRTMLGRAIKETAAGLELTPGRSPSSTVTIAREAGGWVDVLALGDSVAVLPDEVITDDRMDALGLEPRRTYRERLAAGGGYDDRHREILRSLQTEQAALRNREGGYWIAEASEGAAQHALIERRRVDEVPWLVLATDGAYDPMRHLGLSDWPQVCAMDSDELHGLLVQCQAWEAKADPSGKALPRAKRHDDKSLVAVLPGA
ncbi:hypothetical protein [Amycolatopsis sp. NPDC001319]|uniref:hypothetical protein n=1 Tax=unclassified Amycolatopsis TaxID=2618356 RepID=UPI00368E36B9